MKTIWPIFIFLLFIFGAYCAICDFCPISRDEAIDAIVGEASNQSPDTMVCVAQGIRHRGNLKGVYGSHAPHSYKEREYVWQEAQDAWDDSELIQDQIKGAKNWGTFKDIQKLGIYWGRIKVKCGDFYFY